MNDLTLVIGNKTYSSWSLRAWAALAATDLPFEEVVIPLRREDTASAMARWTPAGKVPTLWHGDLAVWDSLAIVEYVADLAPEACLLPTDPSARAVMRSVIAEMHSGFPALRRDLPMRVGQTRAKAIGPEVQRDVDRVFAIWRDCLARFGGDPADRRRMLFGTFSAADCFYLPVASRFVSYAVQIPDDLRDYVEALHALPLMRAWSSAAAEEPWVIETP